MSKASAPVSRFAWRSAPPGRLMGRGHGAGDLLEAHEWRVLEQRPGCLRLDVHLPDRLRNPRGQLFGGFAPTYVDLVAIHTLRAGEPRDGRRAWLATVNMRIDYLEPIEGPRFVIESELQFRRGRNAWVQTRFVDVEGQPLLSALTVLRDSGIPLPEDGSSPSPDPTSDR